MAEDARVTDQGDGPEADKGKGKGKEPNPLEARVAALEKELATEKKRGGELAESEAYWHGQAEARAKPEVKADEPEPEREEAVIEDSADSAVDAFSTKGIQALVERGVLTKKLAKALIAKEAKKAAQEVVGVEVAKINRQRQHDQADAHMVEKYPELNDEASPLFLRTREIFRADVKQDPSLSKSPSALMLAARVAKAELAAEARVNGKADAEQDRLARIQGQGGVGGAQAADSEDDDRLSPKQKTILERFNAEGGPQITDDNYRARAKAGVRMSMRAAIPETAERGERREVGDWS